MPPMKLPKFDNVLSIGNIIMFCTMVAGGIWFLATFTSQMESFRTEMRGEIERLDNGQTTNRENRLEHETRIRALELGAGRTDERLTSILQSLSRIERLIETDRP